MKIIDYDTLLKEHKRRGHIRTDANTIANRLISELCIQGGNGLSRFLEVDVCFDNHMALRVWVQNRLDSEPNYLLDEMCCQLGCELNSFLINIEQP